MANQNPPGPEQLPEHPDELFEWNQFLTQDLAEPLELPELTWDDLLHPDLLDSLPEAAPGDSSSHFPEHEQGQEQDDQVPWPTTLPDVSPWLDGAYRPSSPCSHCRRHRLQCLILRTAPVNPNPVTSCSSCAALFRQCSLAAGAKRQADSRFETDVPVLGHLHGLTEEGGPEEDYSSYLQIQGDHDPSSFPPSSAVTEKTPSHRDSKHFVRRGARVLRIWFAQNQEHPYPSEDEKTQLARETGFSQKRISTWFANARRRQKQKAMSAITPRMTRAGSPLPRPLAESSAGEDWTAMTPLERWKASPPEDEPVPEEAIKDALGASASASHSHSHHPSLSYLDSSSSAFDSLSASASASAGDTSSDSVSSAWSHRSSPAFPRLPKRPRRRRTTSSSSSSAHPFQCTFCPQSFKKKNDWSRHEASVHLPSLDSWICTPSLDELLQQSQSQSQPQPHSHASTELDFFDFNNTNNTNNNPECPFCTHPTPIPSSHILDAHEFRLCAETPERSRSFARRDHLAQHLRKFHGCTKKLHPGELDRWRERRGHALRSRCGFCGKALGTWDERVEHLAGEFRGGGRVEIGWKGDWGLDGSWVGELRDAVLPGERKVEMDAL